MSSSTLLREQLAIQRTELANQRTLLAYLRISLYFFVAGFTLEQFVESFTPFMLYFMLFTSAFFFFYGIYVFSVNNRKINKRKLELAKKNMAE